MKGHHIRKSESNRLLYARVIKCNHLLFSAYTAFEYEGKGIGVIQQHFNSELKVSWWGPVEPWIANDIFESDEFMKFFNEDSRPLNDDFYPIFEVRKLMYALNMKPLKRLFYEGWSLSQELQLL